MDVAPTIQREEKRAWLEAALRSATGLSSIPFGSPQVMAGPTEGYRNRIRIRVADSGRISFFNTEKSWSCMALEPSLTALLDRVKRLTDSDPSLLRGTLHFEARAADMDGRAGVFVTADPEAAFSADRLRRALGESVWVGVEVAAGLKVCPQQRMDLGGGVFARVPLSAFVQINTAMNRLLVGAVAQGAVDRKLGTFVDLYAGAGNFTLPLLSRGLEGAGVEIDAGAMDGAREAMSEQNLRGGELFHEDAPAAARRLWDEGHSYDLVMIDPPRAGVREGLDTMAELASSHIALCSCNPKTLARDVASLLTLGFELEEVMAFDMFPHTAHVEALAWLRRKRDV